MKIQRNLLALALALTLGVAAAPRAEAGFGIGGSIGTGFLTGPGDLTRLTTNIEILPHYKFASILAVDLGILFNLENSSQFTFRPGVRIDPPIIPIYFRAAIPLTVHNTTTYGLLLGAGWKMGVGPVSIFIEADAAFADKIGWSNVGVEFRGGVLFSF